MSKRPNTERVDRASKPAGWKRGNESLIPAKGTASGMKAPPKAAKAPAKKK
ncbi:MAG: hypothetical protein H0W15_09230 [Gemmatimonadales bacterium]|nr:hypothetical protein [Gemmatimonadales bacterium]